MRIAERSALRLVVGFCLPFVVVSCMSASQHAADVATARDQGDRLTVGTVQREIRVGMTSADVIAALGSPNIVTTDEQRREQWVYDRISTGTVYSTSHGGINTLILGGALVGPGLVGGGVGGGGTQSAGAASRSQRTLTIVIKFDEAQRVRDFAYRTSSF
jgi:outer membrane protein assembly factor BamE (lipoprotein component of BamABCDE complex)